MADLSMDEVIELIRTRYPQFFPLLQKPGILDALNNAITNNLPAAQVESLVHATPYWQYTPAPQREWDYLVVSDPATANSRLNDAQRAVNNTITQLGMGVAPEQRQSMVTRAVQEGWDANRIRYELIAGGLSAPGEGVNRQWGGSLAATAAQIRSMADDYAVPLSDRAVVDFAGQMLQGTHDQNSIRGYLIEQAKSLFPGLVAQLDRGETVRQYASPYLQIAQQELGVDPNSVSLTDPKWNRALNQVDPKTGDRVSLSLDDWTRVVRNDAQYGYDNTSQAKSQSSQLATMIAQKFGATA